MAICLNSNSISFLFETQISEIMEKLKKFRNRNYDTKSVNKLGKWISKTLE